MNNALITDEQRIVLLANGRESLQNPDFDPAPVVKLFTPDAGATWLLTEIDPDDHDHAFGLCDLGLGEPEIGWISLGELATVRGGLGLPIERDLSFVVAEDVAWAQLAGLVEQAQPELLERVSFVGAYRGKQTGPGKKSVTMRLRFRASDRTLRHEEVDPQVETLVASAKSSLGAELRA